MEELKRNILYFFYRLLKVDIDFQHKCEYCFNKYTWQTIEGKFVCDKHNRSK